MQHAEAPIEAPDGKQPPPPFSLTELMRQEDPKLYRTLCYEELYDFMQKVIDRHIAQDGQAILNVLDDIEWNIGDSEYARDWWGNRQ